MAKMTIGLKVSEKVKSKFLELAAMERRNLSSWMLNALAIYAKDHQKVDLTDLLKKEILGDSKNKK
jgi:hypothetical protein